MPVQGLSLPSLGAPALPNGTRSSNRPGSPTRPPSTRAEIAMNGNGPPQQSVWLPQTSEVGLHPHESLSSRQSLRQSTLMNEAMSEGNGILNPRASSEPGQDSPHAGDQPLDRREKNRRAQKSYRNRLKVGRPAAQQ